MTRTVFGKDFSIDMRTQLLLLAMLYACQSAHAGPVAITGRASAKLSRGTPTPLVVRDDDPEEPAKTQTLFQFHPEDDQETLLTKNFKTNVVTPSPLTQTYSKDEEHGTTGSVTYDLAIKDITTEVSGQTIVVGKALTATVVGTIDPGTTDPWRKVEILASIKDPISFSDSSPSAAMGFVPEGLDVGFSLLSGTQFPTTLSTSVAAGAGDPASTAYRFTARIAPGVINDPDLFWSASLPGAIDLYTVTLTTDVNHQVDAQIAIGSSTPGFTLSSSGAAAAESAIEAAFAGTGGILNSDLNNLFTASFVPAPGLTGFTAGIKPEAQTGAWEVPEPTTLVLMMFAAVGWYFRRGHAPRK